jgi:hypothetical protein
MADRRLAQFQKGNNEESCHWLVYGQEGANGEHQNRAVARRHGHRRPRQSGRAGCGMRHFAVEYERSEPGGYLSAFAQHRACGDDTTDYRCTCHSSTGHHDTGSTGHHNTDHSPYRCGDRPSDPGTRHGAAQAR